MNPTCSSGSKLLARAPARSRRARPTLGALARIACGELSGDPRVQIDGVADIERAVEGQITYAVDRQRVALLEGSRASAAVVPWDAEISGRPVIRVANPYWSWAQVLAAFAPPPSRWSPRLSPKAHIARSARVGRGAVVRPFAVIEEGAVVGDRTLVESGTYVGPHARVGSDCILKPNVTIHDHCVLGNRVIVHASAVVGSDGFGFVAHEGRICKIPQIGFVEIQDDVEIGAGVTIDRATMGKTFVGSGTKIDNLVQIGHNVEIGSNCFIVSQSGVSGSSRIGSNCRLAGQTGMVGHVQLGDNSTVAARGVVTKDLPAGSFVSGFPARPHAEEKRIQVALRRLPEVLSRLKAIEDRLRPPAKAEIQEEGS